MSKFPEPIQPPPDVYLERIKRHQQLMHSGRTGIIIRSSIIIFELIGFLWVNSAALFLDAMSSLVDVISSCFLLLCIRLAKRPPDSNHPFGHGRYEPLGGLLLGLLLVVTGIVLFIQQVFGAAVEQADPRPMTPWAWIFPLTAVFLLEFSSRILLWTARCQNSPALAADAFHYRIDSITSLLATIALILAAYWPEWGHHLDHLGAVAISMFMIGIGLFASKENLDQLLDKMPDDSFFEKVRQAAASVIGVKGTEKIRIQSYGPDAHVDIDVEVDPELSVDVAHQISQQVRVEIQKAWPAVQDVTVHIEPYYANDH